MFAGTLILNTTTQSHLKLIQKSWSEGSVKSYRTLEKFTKILVPIQQPLSDKRYVTVRLQLCKYRNDLGLS